MYRTYRFRGQDPVVGQVKTMFLGADIKRVELHKISGVSASTIGNWFNGTTRRPQFATINAAGRAMGHQLKWVPYRGR